MDNIPLVTEPWLLPIDDAINKADHDRQEAAQSAAKVKGGRHRQR